ncbi:hypothetical protein DEO72_LG7g2214 [Vigna unguiculata]|uniref:Uncharacterized protein n=1 Tax=Vigna unguiculata TaxID=3917 RepID=A0A4D6MHL1_VIGUN|nr:hypothetical protein DEO72_LG7g2214 [Vigna unguiculata]
MLTKNAKSSASRVALSLLLGPFFEAFPLWSPLADISAVSSWLGLSKVIWFGFGFYCLILLPGNDILLPLIRLGISSALETLCGQASGAGQVEMLGKIIVFKMVQLCQVCYIFDAFYLKL